MDEIAIYGAGGLGREIACLINQINEKDKKWNFIGFFDDGKKIGEKNEYGSVIGGIGEVNSWRSKLNIVFAIGSPKIIATLTSLIINDLIDYPNIIAPGTSFLDKNNFAIGVGNIITNGCHISCNVKIGNFNLLNGLITIGHDACLGNFNSVMPAVKISGEVSIGNNNFLGANSTILQRITIGNDTIIGANSLVLKNTKDGNTYLGSPASILNY